jgi:hypothetical protein
MPDITIIKLKVRRGTDAQRSSVVLEQGEIGYTTDTRRLFVGDGATLGGNPAGSVIYSPLLTTNSRIGLNQAQQNDIVSENGLLYQLSGTDYSKLSAWAFVGSKVDDTSIEYDAQNRLKVKNINTQITLFNNGGIVNNTVNGLSANVDNTSIQITGNQLKVGQVTPTNIATSIAGNGLQGGGGIALSVRAGSGFGFTTNTLVLTSIPAGVVDGNALSANSVGVGLTVTGNKLQTVIQTVDNTTIENNSGTIGLKAITASNNTYFKTLTYNDFGQITGSAYTIVNAFTARNTGTSAITAFNGAPDQLNQGYSSNSSTRFTVISGNGSGTTVPITLSAAGFIAFQESQSINDINIDRFAIPIFTY